MYEYTRHSLIHMNLTRPLLDASQDVPLAIINIMPYENTSLLQVATLYRRGVVQMNHLWIMYIYMVMVKSYHEWSAARLLVLHDYVIERLSEAIFYCGKKPKFVANQLSLDEMNCLEKYDRYEAVEDNINEMDQLIPAKTEQADDIRLALALSADALLLGNFGSNADQVNTLMNAYNVQVKWINMPRQLTEAFYNAKNLDWSLEMVNGRGRDLQSLRIYYNMTLDFVKTLILRLTWLHLLHLKNEPEFQLRSYVEPWSTVLQDFMNLFDLNDDKFFAGLLLKFSSLVPNPKGQQPTILSGIDNIRRVLANVAGSLTADATTAPKLNKIEKPESDILDDSSEIVEVPSFLPISVNRGKNSSITLNKYLKTSTSA